MKKVAVAYYRVSTKRQGDTKLGLEAQRKSVRGFAKANGYVIVRELIEVQSGKRNNRPVMRLALETCALEKATLLVSNIDRLSRSLAFIATLMDEQLDFISVDDPNASELIMHIKAAIAQDERKTISRRTKDCLQVAKEKGVELGKHGKNVLSKENKQKALDFALSMKPVIDKLAERGITSVRKIAKALNRRKVPTYNRDGSKWHPSSVHTLLRRLQETKPGEHDK